MYSEGSGTAQHTSAIQLPNPSFALPPPPPPRAKLGLGSWVALVFVVCQNAPLYMCVSFRVGWARTLTPSKPAHPRSPFLCVSTVGGKAISSQSRCNLLAIPLQSLHNPKKPLCQPVTPFIVAHFFVRQPNFRYPFLWWKPRAVGGLVAKVYEECFHKNWCVSTTQQPFANLSML